MIHEDTGRSISGTVWTKIISTWSHVSARSYYTASAMSWARNLCDHVELRGFTSWTHKLLVWWSYGHQTLMVSSAKARTTSWPLSWSEGRRSKRFALLFIALNHHHIWGGKHLWSLLWVQNFAHILPDIIEGRQYYYSQPPGGECCDLVLLLRSSRAVRAYVTMFVIRMWLLVFEFLSFFLTT